MKVGSGRFIASSFTYFVTVLENLIYWKFECIAWFCCLAISLSFWMQLCKHLTRYFWDAVRYKDLLDDAYADLCSVLKSNGDTCAIVYCLERTTCDELSAYLSAGGISCAGSQMFLNSLFPLWNFNLSKYQITYFAHSGAFAAYHAGLNDKARSSVLDDWISSRKQVVVATVAFGYSWIWNFPPFVCSFKLTTEIACS